MLLAEPSIQYRLSRSDMVRRRVLRRILRCEEQLRRLFGQETFDRDRRRDPRQPLQVPINLRPARLAGLSILTDDTDAPFLAITSNISLGGVGFVHDEPLPARIFLAEFDVADEQPVCLLVEACWTARPFPHAYRSGGRIRGVARLR
jgi:hypothetical protein